MGLSLLDFYKGLPPDYYLILFACRCMNFGLRKNLPENDRKRLLQVDINQVMFQGEKHQVDGAFCICLIHHV